jgi:glucose/mannose transport system permease protein
MDLRNLVLYAAGFMLQCIIIGFIIAALLDQKIKGEGVFLTIFVFPFAVSGIVTGVAWRWLMYPETGLNLIFDAVGLSFLKGKWYADPSTGILAVTIAGAWQFTGYVMSLYLAGLRGIPHEVKEAAAIDGAGTFQLYRHIIIPLLAPVTFTAVVLTGMGAIRVFDVLTTLSGSGAAYGTDMLAYNMVQQTFAASRYSTGAVIAAFMMLIAAVLVIPYLRSLRKDIT